MPFIRTKKNKDYTVINNTGLKDNNLSWGAKGLLAYLLSLPDDWKIMVEHLKKVSKDGRDSVNSKIEELMNCGYITRDEKQPFVDGRRRAYNYTVMEKPLRKNSNCNTVTENPEIVNTKEISTNKLNTNPKLSKDNKSVSKETHNSSIKLNPEILEMITYVKDKTGLGLKLPKDYQDNRTTNTVLNIQKFLLAIKNNKLESIYRFNKDWSINNNISFNGIKDNRDLFRLLKRASRRFLKAKEFMKKLPKNFSDFLYNNKSEMSWLLYFANNKIENNKEYIEKASCITLKKKLSNEVKELSKIIYNKNIEDYQFWKGVKDMSEWIEEKHSELRKFNDDNYRQGWEFMTEFGNTERLFKKYRVFMDTIPSFSSGNFGMNGKTWNWFCRWAWDEYHVNLDFQKRKDPNYDDSPEDYEYGFNDEITPAYLGL